MSMFDRPLCRSARSLLSRVVVYSFAASLVVLGGDRLFSWAADKLGESPSGNGVALAQGPFGPPHHHRGGWAPPPPRPHYRGNPGPWGWAPPSRPRGPCPPGYRLVGDWVSGQWCAPRNNDLRIYIRLLP